MNDATNTNNKNIVIRNIVRIFLILFFIACIVIGIINGEARVVLTKAINICLECIGIG
jgi:hypothetical protein